MPIPDAADDIARRIVADGVAPQAAAGCAICVAGAWRTEVGGAVGCLFDLASLTKPMTAVAIARTGVDRRAPLGSLVAEARETPSEHMPLELLLAHRAGLEAHRALYAPLLQGRSIDVSAALREASAARRPDAVGEPPAEGFPPLYSDLGYILAGEALARATGQRDAGEAVQRLVLEPLGIAQAAGTVRDLAARGVRGPFAPTETVSWRGGPVVGAVHDENAWALTGSGGSGHAGIFATVNAVLMFAMAVLDGVDRTASRSEASVANLTVDRDLAWVVRERPGGELRAGFDGKSAAGGTSAGRSAGRRTDAPPSAAGTRLGPHSFGHLGFTGTSVWIDPDAKIAVALLTNRVCPSRAGADAIRSARPWAHDKLFERATFLGRA